MKTKLVTTTIATLLLVSLFAASASTLVLAKRLQPGVNFDGPHHNLNVHGVPDGVDKFKDDTVGSGRHSIFIPLENTEPITIEFSMSNVLNWTVEDCDATGDDYASIILPRYMFVDTDNDPETLDEKLRVNSYKVYLVGLGKPGENDLVINPGAEFTDSSGKVYYYWATFTLDGHKNKKHGGANNGQPDWQNGTDLFVVDDLELWIDADGDGVVDQEWTDSNSNGVMDVGEWVDLDSDGVVDSGEFVDTNGNSVIDAGEWSDTNGDGVADAGEWSDTNGNGVMDAGEWVDLDGDGVVDNELIFYTDEWVFNIEYLDGYWWDVQNSGVRLMQVRFYPVFDGNGKGNGTGKG